MSFDKDGACGRWLVLDAKYRASRGSIHDALRDLHVYRDALRRNGTRAAGSSIIVPALDDGAAAYAHADYLGTHAFGAMVSGGDDGGLEGMLRGFWEGAMR